VAGWQAARWQAAALACCTLRQPRQTGTSCTSILAEPAARCPGASKQPRPPNQPHLHPQFWQVHAGTQRGRTYSDIEPAVWPDSDVARGVVLLLGEGVQQHRALGQIDLQRGGRQARRACRFGSVITAREGSRVPSKCPAECHPHSPVPIRGKGPKQRTLQPLSTAASMLS